MLKAIPISRIVAVIVLILATYFTCQRADKSMFAGLVTTDDEDSLDFPVQLDLKKIKERGKLIALTDNSSTSYFIYKGKPMGYEYELLNMFADHLGVDLEIVLVEDLDKIFHYLNSGKGDIAAANITVTKERSEIVSFTEHHMLTRQVLVQRLPENWRKMRWHQVEKFLIRNPIELAGKEIHVRRNSSFYSRLTNLSDEIGEEINVVEVPGEYETEQLIRLVSEGKVQYTVADENVAMINKTYYPDIDVETPISFPQKISWAVRKNSPDLLSAIDLWIKSMRTNTNYLTIYNKYYKSLKAQKVRAHSHFSSLSGGRISAYDSLIKKYSKKVGWDWRLIAAQIYQESRFNPTAESWSGAKGLMQLLPETAAAYGITELDNPEENIRAGTKFLSWLIKFWKKEISDEDELMKFVLASYNVGPGHVIDARRLAEKFGKDPDVWDDNVAEYVLLKSRAEFYNDPVVRNGYCRGIEPYNYVKEILNRYQHYVKNIKLKNPAYEKRTAT